MPMETPSSHSLFAHIASRELFRVPKRHRMDGFVSGFNETGLLAVQHNAEDTIPLSLSFCKTSKFGHILAVSDEDGYVTLFDTRRNFPVTANFEENSEKVKICHWVSHQNAVFDTCWIKEDTQILTASGDQTIKLWDVQEQKCLGVLTGHTGSVKSMCSHPTNSDIIVSGSRDGSFRIWDLRCKSTAKSRHGEVGICSMGGVKGAHISSQARRTRRGKAAPMSITSVLCLKDQVSIATAGAVDSVLKFWDTRNLKSTVTQTSPSPQSAEKQTLHGISSLSQDESGLFLSASCMDNRIYLYNTLQLDKGPLKSFSGCRIESFFVKSAISPDASNIVSGSSDGNAYVWKVDKPLEDPTILKSHDDGEVTAVDWCSSEIGKLATCSDDFTVRTWNKNSYVSSIQCASAIRRRVMAIPSIECKMLLNNGKRYSKTNEDAFLPDDALHPITSPTPITPPKMNISEGHTNQLSSRLDLNASSEKTPESALKSPSSVLNPPSSLKRTIRDYFLASSRTL
ncbi:denticleless protein homolog [Glycine soja]|uniref:Denticleless protein-like isoform A n=1 Tax=Glycine soja TaxID=3848 RepID=A0A445KHD8_GLYSO|nr:denticleless protein homolog [Glycine soja]KHN27454.1 Denticleless protein like [Glycine soja]RZC10302.1 Denticleless protein-like isoform A [Glycine soja]RZC10303.1 Denticleless protein-like isoform B [Glycine soja]